jgi:hypothetical protein
VSIRQPYGAQLNRLHRILRRLLSPEHLNRLVTSGQQLTAEQAAALAEAELSPFVNDLNHLPP